MKIIEIIPFLDWNVVLRVYANDNSIIYEGTPYEYNGPAENEICYITCGEDSCGSYIALEVE